MADFTRGLQWAGTAVKMGQHLPTLRVEEVDVQRAPTYGQPDRKRDHVSTTPPTVVLHTLCQIQIPMSTVEPTNPPISLYQTRNFWAWQTCALNIQRFPSPNICLGIRSTEKEVLKG